MKNNIEQFLGGMSPEKFLKDYWQKKPLLVKGALENVQALATPDNLMEMGQNENFESRMVWSSGGKTPWEAQEGPFTKKQFTRNEKDKWTLIVHGLELYFKEFRQLRDLLNFIPSWQFDDIMSTYSVKGASVGAHIDNYNVFIFQGRGKRLWQLNEHPDETYIEDLDIKLLANFEIENEYELNEGDMLYLPPGVAHHGISLEDSISYSMGFRSFDYTDLAGSFFSDFLASYDSSKCLMYNDLELPKNLHEFRNDHIDDLMDFFKKEVFTKEVMKDWFGRYVTSTQHEIVAEENIPANEFYQNLEKGTPLFRDVFLRFSFSRDQKDSVKFFANGFDYTLLEGDYRVIEKILETPGYEAIQVPSVLSLPVKETMASLFNQGLLFFDRD